MSPRAFHILDLMRKAWLLVGTGTPLRWVLQHPLYETEPVDPDVIDELSRAGWIHFDISAARQVGWVTDTGKQAFMQERSRQALADIDARRKAGAA